MRNRFTSGLYLSRDGKRWCLDRDLVAVIDSQEYCVPAGFTTDLDSVPRIPILYAWLKGRAVKAAVLHDYLYTLRHHRADADRVFRLAMAAEGVAWWRRWPIWLGVRIGGWPYYLRKRR